MPVARSRRAGPWILAAKAATTCGLLAFLLSRAPSEISGSFREVPAWSIGAAVVLLFSTSWLVALRWRTILGRFGGTTDVAAAWRYTLVGGFFNQVLPSGMGGDVFRVWYARKFAVGPGRAIASVVVDRMLGFIAIGLIVVCGAPFALSSGMPANLFHAVLAGCAVLAAGIVAFLFADAVERLLPANALQTSIGTRGNWAQRAIAALVWMAKETRRMLMGWPHGMITISLSLAIQLLVGVAMYFLLRGLAQPVTLPGVMYLFPVVLLVGMLPVSFAGWGLREGASVVMFGIVGVPSHAALTASILYGLCMLVSSLPGAAIWLWMRRGGGVTDT